MSNIIWYLSISDWPTSLSKELLYDPAIPILGIYLEKTIIGKGTSNLYVHRSLFTIAKTWKQPKCPSTEEWIKKLYIYTVEYYSSIKKNKIKPFAAIWMDLKIIIVLSNMWLLQPRWGGLGSCLCRAPGRSMPGSQCWRTPWRRQCLELWLKREAWRWSIVCDSCSQGRPWGHLCLCCSGVCPHLSTCQPAASPGHQRSLVIAWFWASLGLDHPSGRPPPSQEMGCSSTLALARDLAPRDLAERAGQCTGTDFQSCHWGLQAPEQGRLGGLGVSAVLMSLPECKGPDTCVQVPQGNRWRLGHPLLVGSLGWLPSFWLGFQRSV